MVRESLSNAPIEKFISDFELRFYCSENFNVDQVETHVRAFFGEKLLKPRDEKLWVGKDGVLDPNYVEMMQRSIVYWRSEGNERAVQRFEKELEGAENAVKLIIRSAEGGRPLPVLINASDPGDFYVDKEGNKKSVTFVWTLESSEEGGWQYHVFSLPTKHIGLDNHWEILRRMGNLQLTERILRQTFSQLTADNLIAFPVILDTLNHDLDAVAKEIGYLSWDQVEQFAANQLAMENDFFANERREKIVADFTMRIFFAVKDQRPREYQEALVAAMSDTMAIEAGKRDYEGYTDAQIEAEIDRNVRLALALKYRVFEKTHYKDVENLGIRFGDLRALYLHRDWMQNAFTTNPLAMEARSTGCGGSGINYSHGPDSNIFAINSNQKIESLFFDQTNHYSKSLTTIDISNSDGDEPDGRYPEGTYKPGHCRACDRNRKKVWHKVDGGCDCCTTCEHRLAGGD